MTDTQKMIAKLEVLTFQMNEDAEDVDGAIVELQTQLTALQDIRYKTVGHIQEEIDSLDSDIKRDIKALGSRVDGKHIYYAYSERKGIDWEGFNIELKENPWMEALVKITKIASKRVKT